MSDMNFTMKKLSDIVPYAGNPRDNSKAVKAVVASIQAFGFLVPIVVDRNNIIIAGHTRYLAAREIGLTEVPCVYADHLSEQEAKAYRLADNKVSELAVWDLQLLNEELGDIGDEFDMQLFGFESDVFDFELKPTGVGEYGEEDFDDGKFEYECPECAFRFNG